MTVHILPWKGGTLMLTNRTSKFASLDPSRLGQRPRAFLTQDHNIARVKPATELRKPAAEDSGKHPLARCREEVLAGRLN
jgi:hypothetical protein